MDRDVQRMSSKTSQVLKGLVLQNSLSFLPCWVFTMAHLQHCCTILLTLWFDCLTGQAHDAFKRRSRIPGITNIRTCFRRSNFKVVQGVHVKSLATVLCIYNYDIIYINFCVYIYI